MLQDTLTGIAGQLAVLDKDTVIVQLQARPETKPVRGQVCCVQYFHEQQASVFLAPVANLIRDTDGWFLALQRPDQVAEMDARRAFRIPVEPGTVAVIVITSARRHLAELVDISRLGLKVHLDPLPSVPVVGDAVTLRFEEEDGSVVQAGASVVRRTPKGWGLALDVPASDESNPALATIVSRIERVWLRRKRNVPPTYEPLPRGDE